MSQQRGTCWSVTINNPKPCDDEAIAQARQKSGWKVYGQREKGAAGTEHYQLMVTTPQVRFSAVKKAFPRAHIELARDRVALAKYVEKEDTKVSDLPQSQEQYPSHSKVMSMYAEYVSSAYPDGFDDKDLIKMFNEMVYHKIKEGYYLELYAVNPQILSAIKKFGRAIIRRELVRRQTDRQTAEIIVPDIHITNAGYQSEDNESQKGCEEDSCTELSETDSRLCLSV